MPVTLYNAQGIGPLQRTYKWDVSFPILPTVFTSETQYLSKVNFRCISATVPKPQFDPVTANPHGIDIDEPGIIHLNGDITLTIVETTDLIARKLLHGLQQVAMVDSNKVQYDIHTSGSNQASGDFAIKLCRLNNYNQINMTYICYKCFLKDFTDPEFNSTSDSVKPTFTVHYNYFEMGFEQSIVGV